MTLPPFFSTLLQYSVFVKSKSMLPNVSNLYTLGVYSTNGQKCCDQGSFSCLS